MPGGGGIGKCSNRGAWVVRLELLNLGKIHTVAGMKTGLVDWQQGVINTRLSKDRSEKRGVFGEN